MLDEGQSKIRLANHFYVETIESLTGKRFRRRELSQIGQSSH